VAALLIFLSTATSALSQQMDMSQMDSADSLAWRMPPGGPNMAMMMAPFMGILPAVSPFLPGPEMDVNMLPEALVGGVLSLLDGDTLRLEGQVLRRELNGRSVKIYGFNGQSPGPTIRVPQDAEITVEFTNTIDFPPTLR
ncbi:uncharacterized protein METZ01_LOCUS140550, partial [marine metagenome]